MTAAGTPVAAAAAQFSFEAVSVSPLPMGELARRMAEVLHAAGPLAPNRGGISARTARLGPDGLDAVAARALERATADGVWIVFEQRDIGLWGDLRLYPDTRIGRAPRFHSVGFNLPVPADSPAGALLDDAVRLLCRLFEAVDGFHGSADSIAMRSSRLNMRSAAADEGRMWLPHWNDPAFVIWDRWVEDVWWVNLFGPAYVERWGAGVVERLGVRREWLAHGGVAAWSTAAPPDPAAADTIAGYAHKQSYYELLGIETFIHESLYMPEPGARVPALQHHAQPRRVR